MNFPPRSRGARADMKYEIFKVDGMISERRGVDYGSSLVSRADGKRVSIEWRLADDRRSVQFLYAECNGRKLEEKSIDDLIPLWRAEILKRHAFG